MAYQSSRRSRHSDHELTTATEDMALKRITREAEAKLAAKRASRAEARSIRMKELEKAQQEVDRQANNDFELRTIQSETKRNKVILPDSKKYIDGALDEKYQQLQSAIAEADAKYRQAMVGIAQLDNERQALVYTVDYLKDKIETKEEVSKNVQDELSHKSQEFSLLRYDHENTLRELAQVRQILQERDQLLEDHGISKDGTIVSGDKTSNCSLIEDNSVRKGDIEASNNDTIKTLKEEIARLKNEKNEINEVSLKESRTGGSVKRDMQKQVDDLKSQIYQLQQQNAKLEGQVNRLETQVTRYKQQADNAESLEDALIAEKRKIAKQLRQSQEQIVELETENELLQKRLEKLRAKHFGR